MTANVSKLNQQSL